jgi:predicted PurR-regulated permease PerM
VNSSSQHFEIGWATLWRVFLFIAGVAALYFASGAFAVLFVGIILSLGLDPLVSFVAERLRIGRIVGTLMIFLCALIVLVVALYFIVPVVASEVGGFFTHFNESVVTLFNVSIPIPSLTTLGTNAGAIINEFLGTNGSVPIVVTRIFGNLLLILAAFIITLYLTIEKDGADKMLRLILPQAYERQVLAVFDRFKLKMRRWLGTQLVLSLFIGLAVGLGMWLIGVRYPLILGVIAAILEVVPIIGPIVTGAIAFLIAITDSVALAVYAVIFFFVIQQFENHVLVPVVMGRSMRVHPVLVVFALLAGGELAGFVGIILAVPISVLAQEIFDYMAERKKKRVGLEL